MTLIEAYREYYTHLNRESACNLLTAISLYDFQSYEDFNSELWDLHRKVDFKTILSTSRIMTSSGSLGQQRDYEWGPWANEWIRWIEGFVKNPEARPLVFVRTNFSPQSESYLQGGFSIERADYLYSQQIMFEVKFVSQLLDFCLENPHSILGSYPTTFLYLLRDPYFLTVQNGLFSTDYEGFYPSSLYINDNMVDWTSGCNFYTCFFNRRHFLPIFAQKNGSVKNLLNLACGELPCSDLFDVEPGPKQCGCGRMFLSFRFVPHLANAIHKPDGSILYDLSLADRLQAQYSNFQIVQQDGLIYLLYVSKDRRVRDDMDFLRVYLREQGFDRVEVLKNRYVVTGGSYKLSAFYNNHLGKPFQKWIPDLRIFA
jgi:hypothetical protein